MDEVTLSRIFDPFFTTNPVGKGTGLGLSMVYTLVMQHGGHITAHSKPQEGTTFNLYFPVIEETASSRASMAPEEVENDKGTILLVDDDSFVRDVSKKLLTKLGYDVITSGDGKEALKILGICGSRLEKSTDFGFRNEDQRQSPTETNPKSKIQNRSHSP